FTSLPPAASYQRNGEESGTLAHQAGWLMAMELRSLGVDISFAPVLDVDTGISEIIGNRAFAREPEAVTRLANRFMLGMHEAGMAATGKHFPGHGGVAADSHLELPIDPRTKAEIFATDIRPFQVLIAQGLDAIMPAHVVYPAIDAEAAGYSKVWLQDYLRGFLGFKGIIFSDDLTMAGAESAGSYGARAHKALQAGCDMVLVCNAPEGAAEVLEEKSTRTRDTERSRRIQKLQGRFPVDRDELLTYTKWKQVVQKISELNETQTP
ncbi:MAG: beta-N-acetylhexosaminidase, partial [Methylococcaceae bacterium]